MRERRPDDGHPGAADGINSSHFYSSLREMAGNFKWERRSSIDGREGFEWWVKKLILYVSGVVFRMQKVKYTQRTHSRTMVTFRPTHTFAFKLFDLLPSVLVFFLLFFFKWLHKRPIWHRFDSTSLERKYRKENIRFLFAICQQKLRKKKYYSSRDFKMNGIKVKGSEKVQGKCRQ